jgi:hypothetical protein
VCFALIFAAAPLLWLHPEPVVDLPFARPSQSKLFYALMTPHALPPSVPRYTPIVGKDGLRKYVSFSLFAKDGRIEDMYSAGLVQSASVARQTLPDWNIRIYLGDNLRDSIPTLVALGVEIVLMPFESRHFELARMWRFLPEDDPTVDVYIVRDTDSRIWSRDLRMIQHFLASGLPFHTAHERPLHTPIIMGGCFGGRRGEVSRRLGHSLLDAMAIWVRTHPVNRKGQDQFFLEDVVWPVIKADAINYVAPLVYPEKCFGAGRCFLTPPEWRGYTVPWLQKVIWPWAPLKDDFVGRVVTADETYDCTDLYFCKPQRGVDWKEVYTTLTGLDFDEISSK